MKDEEFKLKDKIFKCPYVENYPLMQGTKLLFVKDVAKKIKDFKEDWKEKCNRMEIMSGDVAVYEFNELLKKHFGDLK